MLHVHRTIPRVRPRARARRGRRGPVWPDVAAGRRPRARPRAGVGPRTSSVRRRVLGAVLAMTAAAVALVATPIRAADGRERGPAQPFPAPVHVPPVDAPIADPFRPPAGPYGGGNRGLDYDTTAGDVVRASAAGRGGVRRPGGGLAPRDGAPRRRGAHELLVPPGGEHDRRRLRRGRRSGRDRRRAPALRRTGGRRLLRPCRPLRRSGDGRAAAVRGASRVDPRRRGPCPGRDRVLRRRRAVRRRARPGDGLAARPRDRRDGRAGGRPGLRRRGAARPRPLGGRRPRRSAGVPASVLDRPTTGPPGGP